MPRDGGGVRELVGEPSIGSVAEAHREEWLQVVDRAEALEGRPVEVEWGLLGDELCLYQSRPLTRVEPWRVHGLGAAGEGIPHALTPLSESVLIDGVGWAELLEGELDRVGRRAPGPVAVRHRGRWFLRERPLRGGEGDGPVRQLRLLAWMARTALRSRRVLASVDGALDGALDGAAEIADPRALIAALRTAVELDHAALLATELLRDAAVGLGGDPPAPGGLEAGNRHARLLAALRGGSPPSVDELVREYGDLSDASMELAVARYGEDPEGAFAVHQPFAGSAAPAPADGAAPLGALLARATLEFARIRERARDRIDRANAVLRRRALADQAGWEGAPDLDPPAVFFLRLDEWTGERPPPETLVERAAAWRADADASPPGTIAVGPGGEVRELGDDPAAATAEGERRGIAAGPGTARGPLRILPTDSPTGDAVLVVPDPDPRWVRSLVGARAVVLRTGGALSHLAMVARDLGLPCVVLPDLDLPDGTEVTVDGTRGVLRVVGGEVVDGGGP